MRESVFSQILGRKESGVGIITWWKLILLECYLGDQLIEMLSTTASFRKPSNSPLSESPANGWSVALDEYIPSTSINKYLNKQIIQLLEIKFVDHYRVLVKEKGVLYTHNPENLFLLTELKLAYNTIWVTLNLTIDVIVFVITKDLTLAILSGGVIEFIRRFKW